VQKPRESGVTIGRHKMPAEAEILAVRLARIKTLLDALERASLENEALRKTFLTLKQEFEACISVRPVRPRRQ
jgi:hypothetical protein